MPKGKYERRCVVCDHPNRGQAEFQLVMQRPLGVVAKDLGVSRDRLSAHWRHHVSTAQRAEMLGGRAAIANLAERARAEDRSLLDYLSILRSRLMTIFNAGNLSPYDAAIIAQRLLNVLEVTGKLTGELKQAAAISITNVNGAQQTLIMSNPEVVRLQQTIIKALRPHPAARRDVIEALRAYEGESSSLGGPLPLAPMIEGARADV